jgi:isopentenyl-diphosphate delta-isomerase
VPGRNLDAVDLSTSLLGRRVEAPLLVSCMTGGTDKARQVNERLAETAEARGLAMGLGSGRALLLDEALLPTYRTPFRPPIVLANLGAVQFNTGLVPADAERLVDLVQADGLVLHLNGIQEAIQPEGETHFDGVVERIAEVVQRLAPRPVVAKEVGFGLAPEDVASLADAGVAAVDVAGAGGTNWALAEGMRDQSAGDVAVAFRDWGWPTELALREALPIARSAGVEVIASGGIGDGVEAAIALALGAHAVGMARPFLLAALEGRVAQLAEVLLRQLRIAVWSAAVASVDELGPGHLLRTEGR